MEILRENVHINDGWIEVDGIGTIGRYLKDIQSIGLDYSMLWIVGTNDRIKCSYSKIKDEIVELFNKNKSAML